MTARVCVCVFVFVLACSSATPETSDAGTDASSHKDSSALTDVGAPMEAAPDCVVSGNVVDSSEVAWAAAKMQVCSVSLCTLGNADGAGAFHVGVPCGLAYHVLARPPPSDSRTGSAGIGVVDGIVSADVTLASSIHIPVTGSPIALDADASASQNAAVTTDLTLGALAADVDFYGAPFFAGVRVASAQWPAFVITGKTILAMWALNPWGTPASVGKSITVTIANSFSLQPNDTAFVYAINDTTADLETPTQATVSSDGLRLEGATIDRVTWIVLAR